MSELREVFNESMKFLSDMNKMIERIALNPDIYIFEDKEEIPDMLQDFLSMLEESITVFYAYNFFDENQKSISNISKKLKESNDKEECIENLKLLNDELNRGYDKLSSYLEKPYLEDINLGNMSLNKDKAISEGATINDICKYLDSTSLNDLEKFAFYKKHNNMMKWLHYFEIYDRHFQKYRNRPITVMEIGVFGGGSMQMWKDYFGPHARIIGIDIEPKCKEYEDDQIEIYIGSQEDREFLRQLKEEIKSVDILIDDGGHSMNQQIVTFEELYDCISEDGVYLCEDLHTSYWERYGGGYQSRDSYIEYSKTLIDKLNAWHTETKELAVNSFTKSTHSLHYYDSILVIEKRKTNKPLSIVIETK